MKMLQQGKIKPKPERIVVLYKRWQPLYTEMKKTIPNIEFIQGVPAGLDNDNFFDVNKNNVVLLDDLLSTTANDPKIADLYTEGSHHRNLSVINLTQNLFPPGKNSTTQRRNTQYMVIFKSPMSVDQIRTLGTFMFPGRLDEFIKVYHKATDPPYGYLIIDAKQHTKETDRFKTNILGESIKGREANMSDHMMSERQSEHIENSSDYYIPESETMVSCDECGLMFENIHDLQRHVKNWCPETVPAKKAKIEPVVDTPLTSDAEWPVFYDLMSDAREEHEDEWQKKVEKYIGKGMEESEAAAKADKKMKDEDLSVFLHKYSTLLQQLMQLRHGLLHNKITASIDENVKEGYSNNKAIKKALRHFKGELNDLFEDSSEESGSDSDSDEDI